MKINHTQMAKAATKPWRLQLLPFVALLLILWQIPWVSLAHRQAGARSFLRVASQNGALSTRPGWPASVHIEAEALESAVMHLHQADSRFDTDRILGVIALATNDLAGAQQRLVNRLETAPADVIARFYLGEIYLRLGDTNAVIEQWTAAGAQEPLRELAQDLVARGAETEALAALDVIGQLDETDKESRELAAKLWAKQGNFERALALYREVIAIDPESIGARRLAAELWLEQGNVDRALALYQEIIAIAPEKDDGYMLSGQVLFDKEQYEQAITFFEQALQRNSENPRLILVSLARSRAALGQWHAAAKAIDQAIQADPSHDWDYVLMGDAQCQLGHPGEAQVYYEQAITLGNQSDNVRKVAEYLAQYGQCPP
jgi:tetratricopeptide (TPR) repeat protein